MATAQGLPGLAAEHFYRLKTHFSRLGQEIAVIITEVHFGWFFALGLFWENLQIFLQLVNFSDIR